MWDSLLKAMWMMLNANPVTSMVSLTNGLSGNKNLGILLTSLFEWTRRSQNPFVSRFFRVDQVPPVQRRTSIHSSALGLIPKKADALPDDVTGPKLTARVTGVARSCDAPTCISKLLLGMAPNEAVRAIGDTEPLRRARRNHHLVAVTVNNSPQSKMCLKTELSKKDVCRKLGRMSALLQAPIVFLLIV